MQEKLCGTAAVQNTSSEFFVEYYLIEGDNEKYGFRIDKKEKKTSGETISCEEYTSKYVIEDEREANEILTLLTKNMVTPTTIDCVLQDLGYIEKNDY